MGNVKNVNRKNVDYFEKYFEEICKYSLLTVEEENRLADLIQGNDIAAADEAADILVKSNLRLVVKIASKYCGRGLSKAELVSEGTFGLMRAAMNFKNNKGAKFSTYASYWIREYIRRGIAYKGQLIHLPLTLFNRMNSVYVQEQILKNQLKRMTNAENIVASAEFNAGIVSEINKFRTSFISIDAEIKEGENNTFSDIIADPAASAPWQNIADCDTVKLLNESLQKLDERERNVLELRFYQGKTLEDIGISMGKTKERIRQIQNDGLQKLCLLMKDEISTIAS